MRYIGSVAVAISLGTAVACGSSDKTRTTQPILDEAGTGGTPASGGAPASGGTPSSGGTVTSSGGGGAGGLPDAGGAGGTGGVADAGSDADAADAAETGPGQLVCTPIPNPNPLDAGADADAAATLARWRDWDNQTCGVCPSHPIGCAEFEGVESKYDTTSSVLTLRLAGGVAEIVSGTVTMSWNGMTDAGSVNGAATATLTVTGNTLTATFAGTAPENIGYVHISDLSLRDACGEDRSISFGADFASDAPDGGTIINIHCET